MYLDGETADVVCHMGGHASRKGQRWGLGEDPWEPWFDGTQEDIMFTFPRQCEFKIWQRLCWMKLKKKYIWVYYPKKDTVFLHTAAHPEIKPQASSTEM